MTKSAYFMTKPASKMTDLKAQNGQKLPFSPAFALLSCTNLAVLGADCQRAAAEPFGSFFPRWPEPLERSALPSPSFALCWGSSTPQAPPFPWCLPLVPVVSACRSSCRCSLPFVLPLCSFVLRSSTIPPNLPLLAPLGSSR